MITIESVRLRNFRAIKEAYFQPLKEGITGILGSNGAGKTTILAGVLFALFGTKPPGSSVASLRRSGTKKDDECSVSVVFKHMKDQIEVIREIRGANNRVVLYIYVNGVESTTTSVGAGETWISQRLGIDAAGFLTAFVVRQKELDQLINARPAERKAIIERLAGIETINEALKKARKDENTARDVLETLPGSISAISDNESQVLLLTEKVEELTEVKANAQSKLESSRNNETLATSKVEELKNLETTIIRLESQKSSAQETIRTHEGTVKRLAYVESVENDFDIEALRNEFRTLNNSYVEVNNKMNALQVEIATAGNRKQDLVEEQKFLKGSLSSKVSSAEDELKIAKALSETEDNIAILTETISNALVRKADLDSSIGMLNHNTECPTCHSELSDPGMLIKSLQEMADELTLKASSSQDSKNEELIKFEMLNIELQQVRKDLDIQVKLTKTEDALALISDSSELLSEIEALTQELEVVRVNKDKNTELGIKAGTIIADKEAFAEAHDLLNKNEQKYAEAEAGLVESKKRFSRNKLVEAESGLIVFRKEVIHLNNLLNESFGNLSTYQSRLSIANNNYQSAVAQWNRKKELLEAQEKRALTTELIDKFRRESVASLTPELSENATELISDITNGAYTEIKIDDDFNISVINSLGDERKIGELSGGEESAVALSLRLAIGLLITGRSPELLWLDEVLTAQDADRRAAMLSTIRSLPYKQIIMINHTAEASSIIDKAIEVVPDVKNGSTLRTTIDTQSAVEHLLESLDDITDED